jgi:signal transduction histidine kinase
VVLENLLDNARKYGGRGVTLTSSLADGRWRLAVRDQGVGFAPGDAEYLFDPFARKLQHGMTTHGSGLGLYLSRQLARDMRGELSAVSEGPGRGSTFILEVPVASAAPASAKENLARA